MFICLKDSFDGFILSGGGGGGGGGGKKVFKGGGVFWGGIFCLKSILFYF